MIDTYILACMLKNDVSNVETFNFKTLKIIHRGLGSVYLLCVKWHYHSKVIICVMCQMIDYSKNTSTYTSVQTH